MSESCPNEQPSLTRHDTLERVFNTTWRNAKQKRVIRTKLDSHRLWSFKKICGEGVESLPQTIMVLEIFFKVGNDWNGNEDKSMLEILLTLAWDIRPV